LKVSGKKMRLGLIPSAHHPERMEFQTHPERRARTRFLHPECRG